MNAGISHGSNAAAATNDDDDDNDTDDDYDDDGLKFDYQSEHQSAHVPLAHGTALPR